ncbi:uncharacterized protein K452DRAFT_297295 [Aplosporella prunicola CBS 121167]|uniref:EF-hand domain-containing protein n=1 Tax=Aplosporella prunicola CBS 121167 TaxID=1176127 RepID=A0A6A6BF11_9PEZI|nr:uncharacterized protein K452DRAFT_297295 [Aplosporella prunicola CBS 121167]KAF2142759.1 hypothetical protein K452DRAFT_297295 [Aplosporella prunicola CBS 121167]
MTAHLEPLAVATGAATYSVAIATATSNVNADAFERAKGLDTGDLTLRRYTGYVGVSIDDPIYVDWFNKLSLSLLLSSNPSLHADDYSAQIVRLLHARELTLLRYTQLMGVPADDPVYVDWFNRHDRNGDGVITADELSLDELEL